MSSPWSHILCLYASRQCCLCSLFFHWSIYQGSEWLSGKSIWLVFKRSWVRIPAGSRNFFHGIISHSLRKKTRQYSWYLLLFTVNNVPLIMLTSAAVVDNLWKTMDRLSLNQGHLHTVGSVIQVAGLAFVVFRSCLRIEMNSWCPVSTKQG